MSLYDHLELGPNCPSEDTSCDDCPERRRNGCPYAPAPCTSTTTCNQCPSFIGCTL